MALSPSPAAPSRRRPLVFLVPLLAASAIGGFLAFGLGRDPSQLPSALVSKPAPEFTLPAVAGRDGRGLSRADLGGRPMLVNVFASWCVPCRVEHPLLSRLDEQGVVIHGINYKDAPDAATGWLRELGDPFERVGSDRNGRVGIEWGVYGVPETFVIDKAGRIAHRHVGPLQPRDVEETILPLLEKLR